MPRTDADSAAVRIAFSVPKKRFPHAVDRNRVKRCMRESWRLQKHALIEIVPPAFQLHLFLIYTGPNESVPDYALINHAVGICVAQLMEKIPGDVESV